MTIKTSKTALVETHADTVTMQTFRELALEAVQLHEQVYEGERKYKALLKRHQALEAATTLHTLVLCEIHGRGYRNEQGCPECQRDAALVRINMLESALADTDVLMQRYDEKRCNPGARVGTYTLGQLQARDNAALLAARVDGG